MARLILLLAALVLLTALTEVGGIVLLMAIAAARLLRWRWLATTGLFLVAYMATTLVVVPPLAAMNGRVPLPCTG